MQLTGTFLASSPFPYFHIDHHFFILSTSIKQNENNNIATFTSFLEHEEMESFIVNFSEQNIFETKLNLDGKLTPHRIYKMEDENHQYHLFCYPTNDNKIGRETEDDTLFLFNVSKLAAGIAHEIRNPLTTVKGFIQLLKPYLTEIGKAQYADIAIDEINRANDLIYEFLDVTKPYERKKEEISLNKLVENIAILYEGETSLQNVQLVYDTSSENPLVFGNRKQLKQVLMNIIKNALEAITDNKNEYGHVHISVESKDEYASIIIKDNGCGIDEDTIQKLFMPFYSTKKTGTGIGLGICKNIIEEHDGSLNVCSTPGKGTNITINLPILNTK